MRVVRAAGDSPLRGGLPRSLVLLLLSKDLAKNLHTPSRFIRVSFTRDVEDQKIAAQDHKLCRQINYSCTYAEHCFVCDKKFDENLSVHFRERDADNGARLTGVSY